MNIVIYTLFAILYVGAVLFYKRLMQRLADIETNRGLSYESEKGKNIATKEDIEEITQRLESVKNEISFAKQRENDFIIERYNHLQMFLKCMNKARNNGNLLLFYLYDMGSKDRLIALLQETNDNVSNADYELQMVRAYGDEPTVREELEEAMKSLVLYSCLIMTTMSNAISYLSDYKAMMDLAYSHNDDPSLLSKAIKSKKDFEELRAGYKVRGNKESDDFNKYVININAMIRLTLEKQFPDQFSSSYLRSSDGTS